MNDYYNVQFNWDNEYKLEQISLSHGGEYSMKIENFRTF